jgi:hypothetical protein
MAVAHGRDAAPSARPLRSPSWRAPRLHRLLEGVAEDDALAPVTASSRIRSVSVPPSLRRQAYAEAVSGVSPREEKATAMRVLSTVGGSPRRRGRSQPFLG